MLANGRWDLIRRLKGGDCEAFTVRNREPHNSTHSRRSLALVVLWSIQVFNVLNQLPRKNQNTICFIPRRQLKTEKLT
jgi:hypothetical protein